MTQKVFRHAIYAAGTLLLCIQTVFNFGTDRMNLTAEAASKKITFASSLTEEAMEAAAEAGADEDAQIVITKANKYLSVYSSRRTSSKVRGYLYSGSGAIVVKTKGSWSYVVSGDVTGWIKSKNLLSGSKGRKLMANKNPRIATVDCSNLNVREDSTTGSNVIVNLKRGEQVNVISQDGDWTKVQVSKNTVGYIYTKYADLEYGLSLGVTAKEEAAMADEIEETQEEVQQEKVEQENSSDNEADGNWVCLGTFKVTAYCGCAKCNGGSNAGKTASGATPKAGYTVAVDRSVISLGTKLRLGNSDTVYKAQDTGVSGNTIDVYCKSHSSALKYGVKKLKVYAYVG